MPEAEEVEVWMRPWDSVIGTRCTRCVPASHLKTEYAPSPFTAKTHSFVPPAVVRASGDLLPAVTPRCSA